MIDPAALPSSFTAALPPGSTPALRSVFIVGAPRCGTTFLAKALARHPEVCFSKPKEPHFFVDPPAAANDRELVREYLRRFFGHLAPTHRVIAEGSPSYLYGPEVAARILTLDPDARFVIAVRNPIEMAPSYHARLLFMTDESETDFATAWSLQEARARGERIPRRCRDPRFLQYRAACSLGAQVEAFFAVAGRQRCHVVVFDDLASNPRKVYCDLLEFIGLRDDGRTEFERKNEHREFDRLWLQRLMMNPPPPFGFLVMSLQRRGIARRWVSQLRRAIKNRNTRRATRPPLDPALRETLRAAFADDIERLGAVIGRDLSHWR
jgi:hypothetical protein